MTSTPDSTAKREAELATERVCRLANEAELHRADAKLGELRGAILAIMNYPGECSRLRTAVGSILYDRLVRALEADQPALTATPIEQQAEAFRSLKRAWEGPGCESDWLEFCQDFDWNEPADPPAPTETEARGPRAIAR